MLPLEHSAILSTCIKRYLVLKTNFWSFLEWLFYTGFTVFESIGYIVYVNENLFI